MGLIYVFLTILLSVYTQLIIKWQIIKVGALPTPISSKFVFLLQLLFNPWIISGFVAGFIAALFWMMAMTKLELSYAFPFVSLSFVLVFILSLLFFHETFTIQKLLGLLMIVGGVVVLAQG
jgi:drug/metabolite transporter (DMT)-like permease